jgi:ribose transport system permease protein
MSQDVLEAKPSPAIILRLAWTKLEARMLLLTLGIAVCMTFITPYFLTAGNLLNLLDQSIGVSIVAIGMTFVILTGGIDLSVGSLVGMTGVIFGMSLQRVGVPAAALLAIAAGAFTGLISGILITRFRMAAFVVTLGVMSIGRSLAYILSGATAITNIPPSLGDFAYSQVLGIRINVWVVVILYLSAWLYLKYTKGGRTIYAVGSNVEAARTAGLSVGFYSVLPYVISGALSAVAIILMTAQLLTVDPLAGTSMELDAIAPVVIGGASLYGGRGSIIGTLLGVAIMVMIKNGLNLLQVSPFWQGSAIGTIIIVAVLAGSVIGRGNTR